MPPGHPSHTDVTPGPSVQLPAKQTIGLERITEEVTMHAEVGDELVVDSMHIGEEPRKGEILAVRIEDGREHYMVRWDDTGHETLFFPGPTSHVLHTGRSR